MGGLFALFLIGQVFGGGGDDDVPTVEAAPVATEVAPVEPEVPVAAEVVPVPDEPGFGDGTHIVGTDIQPGTYRTPGATPGFFELCTWTTLDGPSSNSDLIDVGNGNADEPIVVEIGPEVGAFTSSGCERWTPTG